MYMCTHIEKMNSNEDKYFHDNIGIGIKSIFRSSTNNYQVEFMYSPFEDTPENITTELQNDMNIIIKNKIWFEQWLKRIAHQTSHKCNVSKIVIE